MKGLTWFFLLFVMLGSACKKEEVITRNDFRFENCLAQESTTNLITYTCEELQLDSSFYCDLIETDLESFLTEAEKAWHPFYCFEDGDNIFYSDATGNTISLLVEERKILLEEDIVLSQICDDETERYLAFCYVSEKVELFFSSLTLNMNARIEISSNAGISDNNVEKYGAILTIQEATDVFGELNFNLSVLHFILPFDSENSPIPISNGGEYYETLTIHGETFEEVYSYENPFDEDALKTFYNKDYGIVSIIDKNGTQWRINK